MTYSSLLVMMISENETPSVFLISLVVECTLPRTTSSILVIPEVSFEYCSLSLNRVLPRSSRAQVQDISPLQKALSPSQEVPCQEVPATPREEISRQEVAQEVPTSSRSEEGSHQEDCEEEREEEAVQEGIRKEQHRLHYWCCQRC